jgi:hypothetical protein
LTLNPTSTATEADDADCVLLGGTPDLDLGLAEADTPEQPRTQNVGEGDAGSPASDAAAALPISTPAGGVLLRASHAHAAPLLSSDSPHATQGAPGHVAKQVTENLKP